jgi:hypothetical protein
MLVLQHGNKSASMGFRGASGGHAYVRNPEILDDRDFIAWCKVVNAETTTETVANLASPAAFL